MIWKDADKTPVTPQTPTEGRYGPIPPKGASTTPKMSTEDAQDAFVTWMEGRFPEIGRVKVTSGYAKIFLEGEVADLDLIQKALPQKLVTRKSAGKLWVTRTK